MKSAGQKEISIILPAFNEAPQIEESIKKVEHAASQLSNSYEIIVAEDGSTDGTYRIVAHLVQNNPNLRMLHSTVRLGKGKAIKNALNSAAGDVVVFMDADLSTDLKSLPQVVQLVREQGGMAIGSRHVKGARVQRRVSRTIFSLAYNLFVRLLFQDGIHDHQCGFKAMSREAVEVLREVQSDGFFLDTEMVLLCKKKGFPVHEVAVEWVEKKKRNSKVRLFEDAKKIGLDMLRFKLSR